VLDGLADPFNTAELRRRVLDAWAASPSRFREDANAEEDYALGGYRDRVIVELAQNAADAAVRAGVPGRLRLTLRSGILVAANTGTPLDAAGVEALSTLRASSKRGDGTADGTAGRFGVGFAAVVAVSDAPRIDSTTGSVGWSRDRTRELAGAIPALAAEIAARSGHVPVLRLPFADTGPGGTGWGGAGPGNTGQGMGDAGALPDGYATVVTLPLRDAAVIELVRRLLAETGPALLLALPALAGVVIETDEATRVLTAAHADDAVTIAVDGAVSRWRVAAAGGVLDPALLASRPTEERARTTWSVRWAVPTVARVTAGDIGNIGNIGDADGTGDTRDTGDSTPAGRLPAGVGAVVHAPTPTDEPLGLPALLLATFPLSPDRRHVAPGPLTDFLVDRAAEVYAAMLPGLAPGPGLLDLVPGPVGLAELDGRLARAIASRLPDVRFLPAAAATANNTATANDTGAENGTAAPRVRPRDAVLLASGAPGLADWLAPVLPDLIAGPSRHRAYAVLGVRRLPLAELADMLAALNREPAWWHGLYAALEGASPEDMAELGALPVPLADGRLVRGPRGLLLPGPGLAHPDRLAVLGLRVVHPAAVYPEAGHPLLERLGAVEATPRTVLTDPATRAAVANSYEAAAEASYDDGSPQLTADAVLGLVAALNVEPGEYPWLADLALPGDDGAWYPAGELLLPGSPLAGVVAPDAPFGTVEEEFAGRYGTQPLTAVGVLSTFGLLTAEEIDLTESGTDLDLDGADDWAADTVARLRRGTTGFAGFDGGELPLVALEVTAVRDLDLIDSDRWPQALELLARPPLRAALVDQVRVRLPDGRHADAPSYTAWWLRRNLEIGGHRPGDLRAADSDPLLAGLYDTIAAAGVAAAPDPDETNPDETNPDEAGAGTTLARLLADPAIARALGVRTSLAELLAEPGGPDELLTRLADPARPVTRPQLRALWLALATTDGVIQDIITPPDRVRVIHGDKITVADAADVLILDAPDLWPLIADQPLILAPCQHATRLADLLDLPLASEQVPGVIESAGERRPVPELALDVLPLAPVTYHEHDSLLVDGTDLPWRYTGGELHVATVEGLAYGLAWAAGQWHTRHLLAALLTSPGETDRLLADADLDPS
jgi:hypothetical protein